LLERALAGGDVGEDVGKTLGGHFERIVGVLLEWKDGEKQRRARRYRTTLK